MPYTFSPTEQAQTNAARSTGPNPNEPGNYVVMYQTILDILTTDTGSGPPDQQPDVLPSRLWFNGAVKANGDAGVFGVLIREYTQAQGRLHYGAEFHTGVGAGGFQEASNEIARNVYATIEGAGWQVPLLTQIGRSRRGSDNRRRRQRRDLRRRWR